MEVSRRLVLVLVIAALLVGCTQQQPQPKYSHPDLLFTTATTCAACHDGIRDVNGSDVSMYSNWRETMLSLSAKDPYFLAKVSSEIATLPAMKKKIEEKCLTCHMPMAAAQARSDGVEVTFDSLRDRYPDLALDGVSCTLCHQIRDENLGREESFSGGYKIDTTMKEPDRVIYGPFVPLWGNVMRNNAGYMPTKGEHMRKSELCAVCHTLYTPTVSDGKIVGNFPEQTPFLEWQNSMHNKTCQDCHMKAARSKISVRPTKLQERDIRVHEFVGGNVQMLKLMGKNEGAAKSEEQLKRAVRIEIVSAEKSSNGVKVVVKVENLAGHKFPTGFPSRRAFIHLIAYDSNGNIVFESGKYYSDGRIAGEDKPFERHHDVIESSDDVQIYEAVMVDTNNDVTHTLLKAAGYAKDNRLLPVGFDKANASSDIAVVGYAAKDANFVGESDVVTYILPANVEKVRVELLYQPIAYPFLENLRRYNTPEVKQFLEKFEGIEKTMLVDSDEEVIK